MLKLMNELKSIAKKKGITGRMISKWIGVSEGMVTKYYKAESDMPVIKFIYLAQFVLEDERLFKKFIIDFIKKTDRTDNLQELLEWSSNSGDQDLIDEVQSKIIQSNTLKKDAQIYSMIQQRNRRKITPEKFYLLIEEFKMSEQIHSDSKILLKIATLYSLQDMDSFKLMIPLGENIKENLSSISSDYIKESFEVRTLEMLAQAYLRLGEVEKVEEIGTRLLEDQIRQKFPLPANSMYIILAKSNLFRNKKRSISLINEGIKMFYDMKFSTHNLRLQALESTHDFIKIYHEDFKNLYLSDDSERAHLMAKKGYKKEALMILEGIEKRNKELSPYQLYYKGLATGNHKYFEESLNKFIRQGDIFFTKLSNGV
jgi:hypothetical protein